MLPLSAAWSDVHNTKLACSVGGSLAYRARDKACSSDQARSKEVAVAQLTLVLQILGYNISVGIGADVEKDGSESKEVLVIESSGDTERARVGFVRNDEEDDE
jgi:hypothetical protein